MKSLIVCSFLPLILRPMSAPTFKALSVTYVTPIYIATVITIFSFASHIVPTVTTASFPRLTTSVKVDFHRLLLPSSSTVSQQLPKYGIFLSSHHKHYICICAYSVAKMPHLLSSPIRRTDMPSVVHSSSAPSHGSGNGIHAITIQ